MSVSKKKKILLITLSTITAVLALLLVLSFFVPVSSHHYYECGHQAVLHYNIWGQVVDTSGTGHCSTPFE